MRPEGFGLVRITHKSIAVLAIAFLALFAGAAIVLDRAVRPEFERFEAAAHERDRDRVLANLAALREDMRQRATDYAYWDDSYSFVGGADPDYVDDYSDEWFAEYGVDILVITNAADGIHWTRGGAARGSAAVDRGAATTLAALTQRVNATREPATGVAWLEGFGFAVYAAAPITRSDGGGERRGVFLIAKRLSEAALSEQIQFEIKLEQIDHANSAHMAALQTDDAMTWRTSRALLSLIALRDSEGNLTGAATARQPRDIAALGQRAVAVALALIAVMSALLLGLLWLALRSAVTLRLNRLERHFDAQTGEPAPLADEAKFKDEISRLTEAYNALARRSRDAALRADDAQSQRDAEAAANRMKSDFLANISHELRAPLDAVIGYSELIEEDLADGRTDSARADLAHITDAARHLLGLINEVFDLSKIEAGRLEMKPHAFDVDEMLDEVLRASSTERGAALALDIPDGLGFAYSDQTRLRQCLVNVISSARHFADGDEIKLSARRVRSLQGDQLHFVVCHGGQALSDAQLAHMFEPFAQAEAGASRHGAGFGMSITRKLMELLHGGIDVRSSANEGTTYTLTLPALLTETRTKAVA